jgi:hypothetical protein
MNTNNKQGPIRTCHYCSKQSPSLLRCSQCKSVYFCNRTCQSAAWHPKETSDGVHSVGHRSVCRRLRKRAEAAATSTQGVNENAVANEAWKDLAQQIQSMDCNEAYQQMCMVQDEIRRLQSLCESNTTDSMAKSPSSPPESLSTVETLDVQARECLTSHDSKTKNINAVSVRSDNDDPSNAKDKQSTRSQASEHVLMSNGTWLDQGGVCSIEYLPNVKSYLITLTSNEAQDMGCSIPISRDELKLYLSRVEGNQEVVSSFNVSYYEAKIYHNNLDSPLFSISLPADSPLSMVEAAPRYNISCDNSSISIRIQVNQTDPSEENTDIIDELLGIESPTFSSTTSDSTALNNLCCRTCHNPIIRTDDSSKKPVIHSVLPLPSGYWDEIADYLICYDGVSGFIIICYQRYLNFLI